MPIGGKVSLIARRRCGNGGAPRRPRRDVRAATRDADGQGGALRRARPSPAGRHADEPTIACSPTRFGGKAVECVLNGEFDVMVASQPPDIVTVPLEVVVWETEARAAGFRSHPHGTRSGYHLRRRSRHEMLTIRPNGEYYFFAGVKLSIVFE